MDQFYRARMNEDGELEIPAECREQLGIAAGQEFVLKVSQDGLHLLILSLH